MTLGLALENKKPNKWVCAIQRAGGGSGDSTQKYQEEPLAVPIPKEISPVIQREPTAPRQTDSNKLYFSVIPLCATALIIAAAP